MLDISETVRDRDIDVITIGSCMQCITCHCEWPVPRFQGTSWNASSPTPMQPRDSVVTGASMGLATP